MIALYIYYITYLPAPVRVISCTSCLCSIDINIRANYFVKNHHKIFLCKCLIISDIFSQFNLLAIKELIRTSCTKNDLGPVVLLKIQYTYILFLFFYSIADKCPEFDTRALVLVNVPCNVANGCPNTLFYQMRSNCVRYI